MRTLLAGEFDIATAGDTRVDLYVKLEVQNGSGTWKDVGASLGSHWTINAKWGESIDTPVSHATFTLVQKIGTASLAPLMSTSVLNVLDDGVTYSPLLDIGRLVRCSTATMPIGVALDVTKYREIFTGRIDDVNSADQVEEQEGPITLTCSDSGGWLMDRQTEIDGVNFGTTPGTPLETVIQTILTTTLPSGEPAVTLVKSSTSNFAVTNCLLSGFPKVLEFLAGLVLDTTGEDLRYRYDASHVSQFMWYNPNRSRVTVDATIPVGQYLLRTLDLAIANVRNAGQMFYAGGVATVTAPTSIAKYRRRFFSLPANELITTDAEARAVVTAAVNDLSQPPGDAQAQCPYLWFVQLYDRYTFPANGRQYDQDQAFAVLGFEHAIESGIGSTTMTVAAQIVGAYQGWLDRIQAKAIPGDTRLLLNNWKATDSTDGSTRTFTVTAGSLVYRVPVFLRNVAISSATDPWPPEDDAAAMAAWFAAGGTMTILTPDPTTGLVTIAVTKPDARYEVFVQVDARLGDWTEGDTRREIVQPTPNAVSAVLKGIVTDGAVDVSCDVKGGFSDWPIQVDFFADDPLGSVLATTTLSGNTTLDKTSPALAALGGLSLPLREARRFYVRLTNAANEVAWGNPIAVDRDSVPYGWVTVLDFLHQPSLRITYDDDTDTVVLHVPGGHTKTWSGLAGSGELLYTVGDTIDSGFAEQGFAIEETRGQYRVDVTGGGVTVTIWGASGGATGYLHGEPRPYAPGQGTVSIDANGTFQWSLDGPENTDHWNYAESTSSFPSDATARAGTTLTGRQISRTGGGPLTLGQTIFVTALPYDVDNQELPSIRIRGAYTNISGSRTTRYAATSFFHPTSGNAQGYDRLNWSYCPLGVQTATGAGTPDQHFATVPVALGMTLRAFRLRTQTLKQFSQVAIKLYRQDADGSSTQLGATQTATNAGYSTLTVGSLSESASAGRSYLCEADTMFDTAHLNLDGTSLLWFEVDEDYPNPVTGL